MEAFKFSETRFAEDEEQKVEMQIRIATGFSTLEESKKTSEANK